MPKAGLKEEYDLRKTFLGPNGTAYQSSESLEAWIRFGNTIGNSEDLSGNVSFRTHYGNAPTFNQRLVAGKKSYYAFDGSVSSSTEWNDSSYWASRIGLTGHSTKITMSAWLLPQPKTDTHGVIMMIGNSDIYLSRYRTGGAEYLYLKADDTDATSPQWRTTSPIPDNQWVHVAASIDVGDLTTDPVIYVNGEAQDLVEIASADNPFAGILTYGLVIGYANLGQNTDGEIAEACVWSSILSQEEIRAVYGASVSDMYAWGTGLAASLSLHPPSVSIATWARRFQSTLWLRWCPGRLESVP